MKKQIMIAAIMSMAIALAGCGSVNEAESFSSVSKITTTAAVSEAESTAESTASAEIADSKTDDGNATESKTDDGKPSESKTDKKSETGENKPAEAKAESTAETPAPQGKKAANADISEILGEWVEMGSREAHFITVNSDGSFEAFTNSGTIASGNVTVDTADGVKRYSFNDAQKGLWHEPFVFSCDDGYEMLATIDYPASGSVSYCRKNDDSTPSPVYEHIVGTWYEEDADIGRTITVDGDGRYTVVFADGSTSEGTIAAQSTDDNRESYIFYDNYPGVWYTFMYDGGSFPELISFKTDVNDTMVAFSREPSSLSSSEALGKIVGTWYGDNSDYPALVINADGSYALLNEDGSTRSSNIVKAEIRNGIAKYTFKSELLGMWLVPFELRGNVLVTEDNPVYGTISFSR